MEPLCPCPDPVGFLLQVCSELENKAPVNEIVRLERQQGVINSGFAQNLYMARCGERYPTAGHHRKKRVGRAVLCSPAAAFMALYLLSKR
jgi:hypothetical protein